MVEQPWLRIVYLPGQRVTRTPAFVAWCKENGIQPDDTYRLEIDRDVMVAVVYQWRRDEQGNIYRDPDNPTDAAKREPFTVALASLPELPEPSEGGWACW